MCNYKNVELVNSMVNYCSNRLHKICTFYRTQWQKWWSSTHGILL